MMPLRVAILLKTNVRGEWVVPQAQELQRRGHEVVAILPPGTGWLSTKLAGQGVDVVDSPFEFRFTPGMGTLRGLWRLRGLLRRLAPDVLNYHLYASALAARIASVGLPCRRVHTVVGPLFLESAVISAVERFLWRLDDAIICGTTYTSRLYGQLGCPATRRPVVPCGTDTEFLCAPDARDRMASVSGPAAPDQPAVAYPSGRRPAVADAAETRAGLGIPPDAFVAIMVSFVYPPRRIVHRGRSLKGHDVLLHAWAAFRTRFPRSHLLLVGGGWTPAGDAHRNDLIRDFGVVADPGVTWLDTVADVRPYYCAADVSVSPSVSEGQGAAIEAGAMAVPSIVSDAGGLSEVVGDTGWVVPTGDVEALTGALATAYGEFEARVLADRGHRARRRTVELFAYRTVAVDVADVIEQTATRAPRR